MKKSGIRKPRPPRIKKKKADPPPIKLSGTVWSHALLAEKSHAPERALGDHVPSEGDVRIWPLDRSVQPGKLGFLRATIFNGTRWRAMSLLDGIGDRERSAYASLNETTSRFRGIVDIIRELARSANCTVVWGNSAYYVPNRKMINRLVTHAKDPLPPPGVQPKPEVTALDLLREARAKKPKQDPPIVLSGTVWSYLRLEEVAEDVALAERTPATGDIRLWPVDRHEDSRKRGLLAGSIFDGTRWRALNLSGGISTVEDTTYLGQEELLAIFRRIGRAIKRQAERGNCKSALFGGSNYFVLSDELFKELEPEPDVTVALDAARTAAPPTAPDLTEVAQGTLALVTTAGATSEQPEQGSHHVSPQVDTSRGPQPELFEHLPIPVSTQEKPKTKRKRRTPGDKPEKPPLLPGMDDEK